MECYSRIAPFARFYSTRPQVSRGVRPPHAMEADMYHLTRRIFLALGIIGAIATGSRVSKAQDVTDLPPLTPPGKLVDIGGWRLHLNCTGAMHPGQLTVILEAGIGD